MKIEFCVDYKFSNSTDGFFDVMFSVKSIEEGFSSISDMLTVIDENYKVITVMGNGDKWAHWPFISGKNSRHILKNEYGRFTAYLAKFVMEERGKMCNIIFTVLPELKNKVKEAVSIQPGVISATLDSKQVLVGSRKVTIDMNLSCLKKAYYSMMLTLSDK